jgi:hypothetical protein
LGKPPQRTPDALAALHRCQWKRDVGAGLDQQPPVRIVVRPLLPVALVALNLHNLADMLERQVESRLTELLHEFAGERFVSSGRQLVVNSQAHVVSLPVIVQCPIQSVTHEMPLGRNGQSYLNAPLAKDCHDLRAPDQRVLVHVYSGGRRRVGPERRGSDNPVSQVIAKPSSTGKSAPVT